MVDHVIQNSFYGGDATDREALKIDFEPHKYRSCEEAAKAFHEALKPIVRAHGQDPDTETFISDPATSQQRGYGSYWTVSWEAGPYEWGIVASSWVIGENWYTEPYYSFDLCFTEK